MLDASSALDFILSKNEIKYKLKIMRDSSNYCIIVGHAVCILDLFIQSKWIEIVVFMCSCWKEYFHCSGRAFEIRLLLSLSFKLYIFGYGSLMCQNTIIYVWHTTTSGRKWMKIKKMND